MTDQPLDELNLPTRVRNALGQHGIETLSDIAGMTEAEAARIHMVGASAVRAIKAALLEHGLRFADPRLEATAEAVVADKLTETVERLREALGKAAFQFETYERGHRAKAGTLAMTVGAHHGDTFAAIEKADRNAAMVRMCRDAIDGAALTPAGEDELEIAAKAAFVASGSPGEYASEGGYWRDFMREVFAALSRPNVDEGVTQADREAADSVAEQLLDGSNRNHLGMLVQAFRAHRVAALNGSAS